MNYADALLGVEDKKENPVPEVQPQEYNYAESLLSGGLDIQPGGKVDGIDMSSVIAREELMGDPGNQEAASYITNMLAGIADDPTTQIRIYAKSRFPYMTEDERLKRYGINNGEIVFMGDDGKLYQETPDTWLANLKRFAAQTNAHLPSIVLSIGGSILGGMPVGMLGAGAGEGIRKYVASEAFDEPQTTLGNVKSIAREMAFEGLGELGGRAATKGLNYVGAKRGGKLATAAGPDRGKIDIGQTRDLEALGKEYGIDLLPPSTTGSKRLVDKFNLLADLEASADTVQAARRKTVEQVEDAVYRQINDIARPTTSFEAGTKGVEAAQRALRRPVEVRKLKSGKFYRRAFDLNPEVDIKPVVDLIDSKLATAKGEIRRGLLNAKESLMKPDLPKEVLDESGEVVEEIYDTSLKGLHDAKMDLDAKISKAKKDSLGNTVKRNYTQVKKALLEQMDKVSPEYAKGRKIFSGWSEEVDKQAQKTIVSNIAKLEGDQVVKAAKRIFSAADSTPETVARARQLIARQDPEAWQKLLRTHLQDTFESIKDNITGTAPNIGGRFWKKLFANKRQRDILKAAMSPEEFENWAKFFKVLERSGMVFGSGSRTAPAEMTLKQMQSEAEGPLLKLGRAAVTPLQTPKRLMYDRATNALWGKYADRLATAMTSEKAAKQLQKMYQLKPNSKKLIEQMAIFLGLVTAGHYGGKEAKDRLPASISESELLRNQLPSLSAPRLTR